ncbi:biotin and thiamine synthesis associated domain containing protein [Anaeramoeba ignava]|uniref:Biotin and thiamine synthesis associated domain containing protein n=1 Tax=Anaeramoeba ignava TaxID=1746090 RepID=A0A9Q0RAT4_ANAIG|nr:biotin and thiamine synthesis associated domain containing protein [Anaeramoeba ignava]
MDPILFKSKKNIKNTLLTSNFIRKLSSSFHYNGTSWSPETETNYKLPEVRDIIEEDKIFEALKKTEHKAKDKYTIRQILEKAKDHALLKNVKEDLKDEFVQGLTLEETATLLNMDTNDRNLLDELFNTALFIKQRIYGNRIVLFAPLYVSNYCTGGCLYCGYRHDNVDIPRSKLTKSQLINEVKALENQGHKRILMLTGEHPIYTFDDFLDALKTAASVKNPPHGEIRRINVEIPALSVSDFRRLKATNCVGTYTLFQETYHRESYRKIHPYGAKADYEYRLFAMDRAQIGGIDDIGVGALYGIYDYRFEVLGLLQHAQHLDRTYHAGPHTISVPRIKPAKNTPLSDNPPYAVDDITFKKIVAILRCSVPYTGMILSTRETTEMRKEVMKLGVSQISAGSITSVGSYSKSNQNSESKGQFSISDQRNTDQVIQDLLKDGFVPSFCTGCYRLGRTGEAFMKIAKKGNIVNMCLPNALTTLTEYLIDYSSKETAQIGWNVINKEIFNIPNLKTREITKRNIEKIKKGERDLYL